MSTSKRFFFNLSVIIGLGLISATICQFFAGEPVDRYVHIRNFRYGKDPAVIRCNRGDRLHITFSTDDTGHSFFLEEFDIDAKVSPAVDDVTVFRPSDPSITPVITKELDFTARFPGILNYVISKTNYRCHVWCGPMHAFEQGKLIIMPNTLLFFSLGSLIGILILWLAPETMKSNSSGNTLKDHGMQDLLAGSGLLKKMVTSRWPQLILAIFALTLIYVVIITSIFGTKVSGRNLGVLLMWAVWLFLLIAVMTPLGGRMWCTICPLPFFGDWLQRGSLFNPRKGKMKGYNNFFSGLFLKWPEKLNNNWLKLFVFLVLATFSTTLVASPRTSGITVLMMLIVPVFMALIWEHRAFCRYICPISVFVGPFSGISKLAIRNKSQSICDDCKSHTCLRGNAKGWGCPYGIDVAGINQTSDCGLCLECTRSCTYNNVSLYSQPFGRTYVTRKPDEAWQIIAVFIISVVYSVLYLGPWPVLRDYVNILDKKNWNLFGIYSLILWGLVLIVIPGILYLCAQVGYRLSKTRMKPREIFLETSGALLPLGLTIWIAFVIPMLFVNITFIKQSASDPFGWGWDFFGTANSPWHQLLPQYIPWIQALLVLAGLYLSLRNIKKTWERYGLKGKQVNLLSLPLGFFITAVAGVMLVFFAN